MISIRKTRFILREYRKDELSNRQITKLMKVSKSSFYRIISKFEDIPLYKVGEHARQHKLPGRKRTQIPIEIVEKVIAYRLKTLTNDRTISALLREKEQINISHRKVYDILSSAGMIHMLKKKRHRRTWVRWERRHSLSLWQTDWSQFQGKWLIVIIDDASRLVVGWRLCDNATSENSVEVLKQAISTYGKPKALLTGRDAQFYCTNKEGKAKGKTYFQIFLETNEIQHIVARVNHPQTCGKIERFFGEVKKRITLWQDFKTVDEVVKWHNEVKPHMSLSDEKRLVTPLQAFSEKMHHNSKIIKDFREI